MSDELTPSNLATVLLPLTQKQQQRPLTPQPNFAAPTGEQPESHITRYVIIGAIVLMLLGVGIFLIVHFTADDDSSGGGGSGSECTGTAASVTCVDSTGATKTATCNSTSKKYECPSGYCNTSAYLTSCPSKNQVCQSNGTWQCYCAGASSGTQNQPPSCGSSSYSVTCTSAGWQCQCNGQPIDIALQTACTSAGGTLICNGAAGYSCVCGSEPFDYTDSNNNCGTNTNLTYSCNAALGQPQCLCGGQPLDSSACESGSTAVCTSSGQQSCRSSTLVCTGTVPICAAGAAATCNVTTGDWECPGDDDNNQQQHNGTDCDTDSDCWLSQQQLPAGVSLLSRGGPGGNSVNRAVYSLFCATADDVPSCMAAFNGGSGSGSSGNYSLVDYVGKDNVQCLPSDTGSEAKMCSKAPAITNTPVSIANQNTSSSMTITYAGAVAPATRFLQSGSLYSFSNFELSLFPFTHIGTSEEWSCQPFVMVPDPCGDTGKASDSSHPPLFVIAPFVGALGSKKTGFADWRVFPIQNFHPFLLWRALPANNGAATSPASVSSVADAFMQSKTRPDKCTIEGGSLPFFSLLHVTTGGFVNPTGCHKSDDSCMCGSGSGCTMSPFPFQLASDSQRTCMKDYNITGDYKQLNAVGATSCIGNFHIRDNGSDHHNMFTTVRWSGDYDICEQSPIQNEPQQYLSMPEKNGTKQVGRVSIDGWDASSSVKMNRKDGSSDSQKINILAVQSTNGRFTFHDFYDNYNTSNSNGTSNGRQIVPYAPYPSSVTALPYTCNVTACMVAPLQYALNNSSTSGVYLEIYDWNERFNGWNAGGILVYNPAPASPTYGNAFIQTAAATENCKWTVYSYLQSANATSSSQCNVTNRKLSTWFVTLKNEDTGKYLTVNDQTIVNMPSPTLTLISTSTKPNPWMEVTPNGSIIHTIGNSTFVLACVDTSNPMYSSDEVIYNNTTTTKTATSLDLVFINLAALGQAQCVQLGFDKKYYAFTVPMWSVVNGMETY